MTTGTLIKKNTATGGTNGTTFTLGSGGNTGGTSGNYFDQVSIGSGNTGTFDNTYHASGETLSYKLTQGGANQNIHGWLTGAAYSDFSFGWEFKYDTAPAATCTIWRGDSDTGFSTQVFGVNITTTNKIQVTDTGSAVTVQSASAFTANTDQILRGRWISATTLVVQGFVVGSATIISGVTATVTASSANIQSCRFGITSASSLATLRFTDIGIAHDGDLQRFDISNAAPTANAGPDQSTVEPWSTVTLDGSGSADSDGTIASYAWTQTGGTTVTLSSTTAQKPTFPAPASLTNQSLTFSLVVTDNLGATSTADTVVITVLAADDGWINPSGVWHPLQYVQL